MTEFAHESGTDVWAYCLMPNHVHLVMVPDNEDGLRSALGEAHRRYTRHIDFREGWRGHLWQERFHSFPMDEEYLRATVRYVELNPVKARLCRRPQDRRWSSAAAHIAGVDDWLMKVSPMLERIDNWMLYLSNENTSNDELVALHTRTGRPLGNDTFVKQLENIRGVALVPRKPGRKVKA